MKNTIKPQGYYEIKYGLPTSLEPVPAGYIDWKTVAIYSGIAVGVTVVFAVIIIKAQEKQSNRWLLVTEDMHKKHQEAQDRQFLKNLVKDPGKRNYQDAKRKMEL